MYSVTDAVDIVCTPKTLFAQVDYLQSQCKIEVCIFITEADAISILMHSLRYIWSNYLCDTIHPYYIAVRSDFDLIQHYGSKYGWNDSSSYSSNSNTKKSLGKLCASKNRFVYLLGMHWIFCSWKYMPHRAAVSRFPLSLNSHHCAAWRSALSLCSVTAHTHWKSRELTRRQERSI